MCLLLLGAAATALIFTVFHSVVFPTSNSSSSVPLTLSQTTTLLDYVLVNNFPLLGTYTDLLGDAVLVQAGGANTNCSITFAPAPLPNGTVASVLYDPCATVNGGLIVQGNTLTNSYSEAILFSMTQYPSAKAASVLFGSGVTFASNGAQNNVGSSVVQVDSTLTFAMIQNEVILCTSRVQPVQLNTWYSLVVTYDDPSMVSNMYLNGAPICNSQSMNVVNPNFPSVVTPAWSQSNKDPTWIGGFDGGQPFNFVGKLASALIWNYSIPQAVVNAYTMNPFAG